MISGRQSEIDRLSANTRNGVPAEALAAWDLGKKRMSEKHAMQAVENVHASASTDLDRAAEAKKAKDTAQEQTLAKRLDDLEEKLGSISLGTKTRPMAAKKPASGVITVNDTERDTIDFGTYFRGLATGNWDSADRAKSIYDAMTTGGGGSGVVPSLVNDDVWYALVGRLAITESGTPVRILPNGSYDVPKETTSPSASWLAEQETMSDAGGDFDKASISAHKVGAMIEVSNELLMDAPTLADEVIRTAMLNALTRALNAGFLTGSGASNQPTGIFEATGLSGGDQSAAALTPDLLMTAFHNVQGVGGNPNNIRVIMHPNAALALDSYRENDGQTSEGGYLYSSTPATIANMARVVTDAAPFTSGTPDVADIMVGDFAQGASVYQFGQMRVDVDPYGAFASDSVRFRATMRVDIAVRQPTLLYSLSNVDVS